MKITEALSGISAVTANQNHVKNNQNGFDLLFADANQRNIIATDNLMREGDRGRSRQDDVIRTDRAERVARREDTVRRSEEISNPEPPAVEESSVGTSTQYESVPAETEIDDEQAAANIAAILQLPVETVVELMTEQDITAQDLLDSKAVSKFLQSALDAESPTALLTDPEFPEKFKAINEAMGELLQEAEVEQALVAKTTDVAAKVAGQQQKGVTYVNLEGLEVVNEDGKLIVTEESSDEEVYASTTRTQTTRDASSATTEQQPQTGGQVQEGTTSHLPILDEATVDSNQNINPMLNTNVTKATEVQTTRAATPTQTPVNTTDVIEQIMSQVKVTQAGGQFTEMRMTLRPETLGDIVLRVLTQNGIVIAQFEAENQRVKEALEADFNQLRDALEEQGIQFSELSVSVRQDGNEQMNQFERERQRARHRADAINGEEEAEEVISYHNGVIDVTA